MAERFEQIVIIGGGPAGIAAALQLYRQGHDPVIFEKTRLGGLLLNANLVENYPGFPDGISGVDLVEFFERQLKIREVRTVFDEVRSLDFVDDSFLLTTRVETLRARFVIVASGTKPKTADDIVADESARRWIFHEVYPIRDVKGKKIVIIGAGDAAFDYALSLSKNNEVSIFNRGEKAKCTATLWEAVSNSPSISYSDNTQLTSPCCGCENGIVLKCEESGESREVCADYLLLALGREPKDDFLSERLSGVRDQLQKEGVLHLVGDVVNGDCRQTGIAVGDGIRAAMKIDQRLRGETA